MEDAVHVHSEKDNGNGVQVNAEKDQVMLTQSN
jgi:hypothetical protein